MNALILLLLGSLLTLGVALRRFLLKDGRSPAVVVFDTSYLLTGPPRLPRSLLAGARAERVKGVIPDTVLAKLDWYARHSDEPDKSWLAAQIALLLKESIANGEVEYLSLHRDECPAAPGLTSESHEDQVILVACRLKQHRPDWRVLLATTDRAMKAKAAGLGIDTI
ncbi:MAG: PIN domain-containing protein [Bacillota bacterium]|nr:PIN domain-containing protein [Bacillota bacterium]